MIFNNKKGFWVVFTQPRPREKVAIYRVKNIHTRAGTFFNFGKKSSIINFDTKSEALKYTNSKFNIFSKDFNKKSEYLGKGWCYR